MMHRWIPGTPRPSDADLAALFPGIEFGPHIGNYLVYRWADLSPQAMPLSRMHAIAETWNIEGWRSMTRGALRQAIVRHPSNLSPVPHPLIAVPA